MSSPTVQELYDCYDVVNNVNEKEEIKKASYEKILKGVNGEEKEKRLASQFIANFFKLFPQLYEESFNKLLDLCEDENVVIRKQVIQYLSVIAKSVSEYIPKIADTLIQMLITDDNTEVSLIYSALNNVIKLDAKVALEAIFNQLLTQLDESTELINTFAFKYLNEKFANANSDSSNDFKPNIEALIETHGSKLLSKLSGKDEFPLIVGILSSLKSYSSLTGRQKLISELCDQAKLLGKINSAAKFATLTLNCKQAVKLLSKNVHADELLKLLVDNLDDVVKLIATVPDLNLYELLRCLVDFSSSRGGDISPAATATGGATPALDFGGEDGLKSIVNVFHMCHDQLPPVADDVSQEMLDKFSEDVAKLRQLECYLLATHNLCRFRPEAISADEELLKQFRLRLQFLGRYNLLASKRAAASTVVGATAGKRKATAAAAASIDQSTEGREKAVLVKMSGNVQLLIREFFKPAPTFRTAIVPSWSPSVEAAATATSASSAATATSGTVTNSKRPSLDGGARNRSAGGSGNKSRPGRGGNFGGRGRR